jgi:hypothetical protein
MSGSGTQEFSEQSAQDMNSRGEMNGLRSPQEPSLASPQERGLSWSQRGSVVSPKELDTLPPQELVGINIERYDDD